MSYHAVNNLKASIGRQKAFSAPQKAPVSLPKGYTMQDVYNGYAYVVGNGLAWATIGLAAYHIGKPWVQLLLASNLL